MRRVALAAAGACALLAGGGAGAAVSLWGGGVVEAEVLGVSAAGVRVGGAEARVISWDRVRAVQGEWSDEAAAFGEISRTLWRARTRLQRGDVAMAEPLFEEAAAALRGEHGETAMVAAEGLLRCRLAHGAGASAVGAWLETARLRREGTAAAGLGEDAAIDAETLLCARLAPVWGDSPAVGALGRSAPVPSEDEVVRALDAVYRWSAARQAGEPARLGEIGEVASAHAGVALALQVALAQHGDLGERRSAREALRGGLEKDAGTWREAWRRVGIGRSLVLEKDEALRREGVLELLHVPARFASAQPGLSAIALAEAEAALRGLGDEQGAARLGDERAQAGRREGRP